MKIINEAIKAREKAYAPYSKFKVGAAIELKNGLFIHGANIENASFGLSNCAERSCLFNVYSSGYTKSDIVAMAIVGDTDDVISPCGACRQVMFELLPDNTDIILTNLKKHIKICKKEDLLPFAFSPNGKF